MNDSQSDLIGGTVNRGYERQIWVKPAIERLSLKDALTTNAAPHTDGLAGYS